MAQPLPTSGSIDPKSFPFVLMDLHRQDATGSLKVEGPFYQKDLYFRQGRILFGSSNDPRDQLGAILIESGKITPEQLEEVQAKVGPGSPLAKVLSESGFVSQRELGDAARIKLERIVADVVAFPSGAYNFEDGVLPKGAVDLKLATEKLLLAAVRRLSDRSVVLRHIESMDVVLKPVQEMAEAVQEIEADAARLPSQLDGRRALKEAAGLARIEEFEAAKIACGLLFLGYVRKASEPEADAAAASPFFIADGESASELDLGQTARMAFGADQGGAAPARQVAAPALPASKTEPPPAPREAPAAPAEPLGASASEGVSFDLVPQHSPAFTLPPVAPTLPSPPAQAQPVLVPPPSRAESTRLRPASPAGAAELPLVPPPPRRTPAAPGPPGAPTRADSRPRIVAPDEAPGPEKAPRPSQADLAALDELLGRKPSSEGPLQPFERAAAGASRRPAPAPQLSPRGSMSTGSGPTRTLAILGVGLLVVSGAAVGVYFLRPELLPFLPKPPATVARQPPRPSATPPPLATPAPSPTSVASPSTLPSPGTPSPASPAPSVSPGAPPVTTIPSPAPATPKPIATPAPKAATGPPTLDDARGLLRRGDYPAAARSFMAVVKGASPRTFTIQLLVACSNETVDKAVQAAGGPELFIVPVSYRGRDCLRLCWGLYDDERRASSALRSMPDYFVKGGARPRVVPASELLR
jgi:hypothetical protein